MIVVWIAVVGALTYAVLLVAGVILGSAGAFIYIVLSYSWKILLFLFLLGLFLAWMDGTMYVPPFWRN